MGFILTLSRILFLADQSGLFFFDTDKSSGGDMGIALLPFVLLRILIPFC